MLIDKKNVLRHAVRQYLKRDAPHQLDEFDVVFDDVYGIVDRRIQETARTQGSADEDGLPFDAGMFIGTAITTACWIGMYLLLAVIKYAGKFGVEAALDRGVEELAKRGVDENILRKLRTILLGIIGEL